MGSSLMQMIGVFYEVTMAEYTQGKIEDDHELVWVPQEEAASHLKLEHQTWVLSSVIADRS